jgi:hypothetical protein
VSGRESLDSKVDYVDEMSIWNRPLSNEEYESLGLTPPKAGETFEEWFRLNFVEYKHET